MVSGRNIMLSLLKMTSIVFVVPVIGIGELRDTVAPGTAEVAYDG